MYVSRFNSVCLSSLHFSCMVLKRLLINGHSLCLREWMGECVCGGWQKGNGARVWPTDAAYTLNHGCPLASALSLSPPRHLRCFLLSSSVHFPRPCKTCPILFLPLNAINRNSSFPLSHRPFVFLTISMKYTHLTVCTVGIRSCCGVIRKWRCWPMTLNLNTTEGHSLNVIS